MSRCEIRSTVKVSKRESKSENSNKEMNTWWGEKGGKDNIGLQIPGSKSWTHKCKGQWRKITGEKRKYWPPNTGQQKLVSYPTRWSFSFILGPLHWSSSWQWQPSIAGCRLFQTLLWTQLADFAQFFCKMYLLYMWPRRKTCLVWFGGVLPP